MKDTRITNQRLKILEYLKSVKTHPTAEMVYTAVVDELPAITLATIYRNLNLLAERDEILKLEINGEYRFDADISFHQHAVCRKCGKIVDIFQEEISKYALKKIDTSDFEPRFVDITYHGFCKGCKREAAKNEV